MASSRPGSSKSISSKSLEGLLQCSVCFEQFDSNMRSPRQLQCHHTFCLQCLTSIARYDENGGWIQNTLKCPTCRQTHHLGFGVIQEIPTDHKIVQLMDALSVADDEPNFCHQHGKQPLNFFCKTCEVPVCIHCTVVSHKETKGHEVVEISEALKEFSPQFFNARHAATNISKKLLGRSFMSQRAMEQLTKNEAEGEREIRKAFAGYRAELVVREEVLLSQLRGCISSDKEVIKNLHKAIHHEVSTFRKLDKHFEEAEKQQDISQHFDLMRQMKKWVKSSTDLAYDKDEHREYKYKPYNETDFRKELFQLGNIDKKTVPRQKFLPEPDSATGSDNASPWMPPKIEVLIISAQASVMIYDVEKNIWVPSGTTQGLSEVQIYQDITGKFFRVVGTKLQDLETVINCDILKGQKYIQSTPTFHQWQGGRQVYGLKFASREDAENFSQAMLTKLDTLNSLKS